MGTESVLVSWGRGTKEPQTEGPQTTETYSLTMWRQKSNINVMVVGLFPRGSPRAPAVPGSAARCRARVGATWEPGRVSSATSSSSEDGDPGAGVVVTGFLGRAGGAQGPFDSYCPVVGSSREELSGKRRFCSGLWRSTLNFLNLQLLFFCNPFSLGNLENIKT